MRFQYISEQPRFTVRDIDVVDVARDKNFSHSYRTGRIKHGFIYTVQGQICYSFVSGEEKKIYAKTGELVFVPKNCAYTGTYLEDGTELKIVQFELADGTLPEYLLQPKRIELPDAANLIERFFLLNKNGLEAHPFYYLSGLYELLWKIDGAYSSIPKRYKKLRAALGEMSERYYEDRPISYYAALCGMSEVNFRRLFRDYTGKTPVEYRNDIRLENAAVLLGSGEYTVSEAAESCGFSNLSFFTRLYKRRYGHTPKDE
ncbi:MAG: helix-turn-helix transcriptional regulator [Clostridia bacterium]|nr:helix-turn-helix transcriptional regulator [Clostridia bacterium]